MLGNAIRLALRALRRNVLRSFLTMLGIIIGVAAVIILVTLGKGATQQVTDQIASLGSNLLMVSPGKHTGPGQSTKAAPFRQEDAEAIQREIGSVLSVSPVTSGSMTAVAGGENWTTLVTGSTEQYFDLNNRKLRSGRIFNANETRVGLAVCVIGETVRQKLFGRQDPIGSQIRLTKLTCEVIGLLEAKGQSSMGSDQDDLIVVPLRTFQRRVAGNDDVAMIQVSARSGVSTDKVKEDITGLLRVRRHISDTEDDNFDVFDMKQIAAMLSGTTKMMTALLGAVAGVSLLVGGIGIMNIMLVSVTERTREIGIRLAIGALEREVMLQFLVEAVVVSCIGGLAGVVLALASSVFLADLLNVPFILHLPIIFVAVLFSAAIGVVFGYFPARKAARLDPIEALRHE
jgi:putative ABC transport system permease protein